MPHIHNGGVRFSSLTMPNHLNTNILSHLFRLTNPLKPLYRIRRIRTFSTMGSIATSSTEPTSEPRKLKILMLHGTFYPSGYPPPLHLTNPHPRLHSILHPLPRQNPLPRKAPQQVLPLRNAHAFHQPAQTTENPPRHPSLLPRRHIPHLHHRPAPTRPSRHPRLRSQTGRGRERSLRMVEARDGHGAVYRS